MARIIAIDDEQAILDVIERILKRDGHDVLCLADPTSALKLNLARADLILCDVMMPGIDGFTVCKKLREKSSTLGIIMLTARTQEMDKVSGLMFGADDYITKPFRIGELCSRIRALLRRSSNFSHSNPDLLLSGPLTIDLLASKTTLNGVPLELTGAEYRLLCLLVKNSGRILARSTILDVLWDGNGSFIDDNTLSVYIRRLREKLEQDPSHPEHLITVRGFGYQWKEAES